MTHRIPNIESQVSKGDVIRTGGPTPGTEWLPLYQGNGRFGTCFGPWGLHRDPAIDGPYAISGTPHFMHLEHFGRGKANADYLLPLAHIYWEQEPENVRSYRQHQSFFDGTLNTRFSTDTYSVSITSWFDHIERNCAGFIVETEGSCPPIIVAPVKKPVVHYNQHPDTEISVRADGATGFCTVKCLNAESTLAVWTDADLETVDGGLRLRLKPGVTRVMITVNDAPAEDVEPSLARTKTWWHEAWKTSTHLQLPDHNAGDTYIRSMAYILSSYNDDHKGMAGPCGLSGNAWPFAFPQDLSYIHPTLLSTGNMGIARSWIETWGSQVEDMKAYTKHLLGAGGVYIPWTTPYGSYDGFHDPEPPNHYFYGLHNSGYLCRMAHETSLAVNDPAWTREFAYPLIQETAAFYQSILKRGKDGLWHMDITPSIGQDETGGFDQKNYLCALFSAQYSLQTAIQVGLDQDGSLAAILKDGLAFETLRSPEGFYYTSAGSGAEDYGKQKHPVQLNPLAFLPLGQRPSPEAVKAYHQRYAITNRASEPFSHGWTIGEFILASARMADVEGWRKDWNNLVPADYADPDFIQFYETSGTHDYAFFVTSHGLITQAILEGLVSEWWGDLRIGSCIPWEGECVFSNIRTLSGVTVSGKVTPSSSTVNLQAWKDCAIRTDGREIMLAEGESAQIQT